MEYDDALHKIPPHARVVAARARNAALKGARGLALDHDETALDLELANAIDALVTLTDRAEAAQRALDEVRAKVDDHLAAIDPTLPLSEYVAGFRDGLRRARPGEQGWSSPPLTSRCPSGRVRRRPH